MAKPRVKARCSGMSPRGKTVRRPVQAALCLSASTASAGLSRFETSPLHSSFSDQNPTPDLSLASSAYSTDSQVARARVAVAQRRQELKTIRRESENVQAYLKGRLTANDSSKVCCWEGLDYYSKELERLKDCVSDRETEHQLKSELKRRELESEELRETVSRLEKTVLDLGGSVNLGGVQVEAGAREEGSLCVSSCE